jgi:AcrR family transcriptional regulator
VKAPTARLVSGARQAFREHGVTGASMAEIARAAGVVRQTVYKSVSSRDDLVELAIVQVCEELQAQVDSFEADPRLGLEDRLVAFLANAIEVTSTDDEIIALSAALPDTRLRELMGGSHPLEVLIHQSLQPLLTEASASGRLRPGATVDLTSRWLQGVLAWFLMSGPRDPERLRHELRSFVVPSVLTD